MTNPILMELIRQALRWLGVLMMNAPWMPEWIVGLTSNEEVVIWVAGLITYAASDTWWFTNLMLRWKKWRARYD